MLRKIKNFPETSQQNPIVISLRIIKPRSLLPVFHLLLSLFLFLIGERSQQRSVLLSLKRGNKLMPIIQNVAINLNTTYPINYAQDEPTELMKVKS